MIRERGPQTLVLVRYWTLLWEAWRPTLGGSYNGLGRHTAIGGLLWIWGAYTGGLLSERDRSLHSYQSYSGLGGLLCGYSQNKLGHRTGY